MVGSGHFLISQLSHRVSWWTTASLFGVATSTDWPGRATRRHVTSRHADPTPGEGHVTSADVTRRWFDSWSRVGSIIWGWALASTLTWMTWSLVNRNSFVVKNSLCILNLNRVFFLLLAGRWRRNLETFEDVVSMNPFWKIAHRAKIFDTICAEMFCSSPFLIYGAVLTFWPHPHWLSSRALIPPRNLPNVADFPYLAAILRWCTLQHLS